MNNTFELPCYQGKRGKAEVMRFRNPESIREMIEHCDRNSHIWFYSIQGDARQAKVNGKVRTWKRDANRVEVPIKYGLYEYSTFTASDIGRILIPVAENQMRLGL